MSLSDRELNAFALRLSLTQLLVILPFTLPYAYLMGRVMGLSQDQLLWTLLVPFPILVLVLVLGGPFVAFRRETRRAFAAPVEGGLRARHLLELGPRTELMGLGSYAIAALGLCTLTTLRFELPWWPIPLMLLLLVAFERLGVMRQAAAVERILMPHALRAVQESGGLVAPGRGIFRPSFRTRQNTTVLAATGSTLLTVLVLVLAQLRDTHTRLRESGLDAAQIEERLFSEALGQAALPLALVGGWMVMLAVLSMRAQSNLVRDRLQEASSLIASLAEGRPRPPSWTSTDETGLLANALFASQETTRGAAHRLRQAAGSVGEASSDLALSSEEEQRSVQQTMAALRETEVTAQELRQTALLALEKSRHIEAALAEAEQAAARGRLAIDANARGLEEIASSVTDTAERTRELGEWARRIDGIARSVKELAAQSNLLALNAGIEAVRAGAHGRSFGIVAREIRSLADQSAAAAAEVRGLIEQVTKAINTVARQGESGLEIVERARLEASASRAGLEALAAAVQNNSISVRQVLEAVNQQSAGISQIFEALRELSHQAEGSGERVARSSEAALRLREAGGELRQVLDALDRDAA